MRRIRAYWVKGIVRIKIGELAEVRGSPIIFEWDKSFLDSSVELSPIRFQKRRGLIELPPTPFNGLSGLFADQIPDGWGRILLRRGFEKRGLTTDDISPLDMLSYIGDRGMGALSFEPALKEKEIWAEGQVDLESLEKGIKPIISGTPSNVLEEFLSGGTSPNGMRPKIIVKEDKGKLFVGGDLKEEAEWIVKFRAPEDSKDVGKLEYIYSLMAKKAGLRVPETKLFNTKKGSFFASKRFDRRGKTRTHMHTLSGILGVSPNNFSVGYDEFLKVTQALTKDIREVKEAFKIAAFNVLSVNQDDHTRNVSFLMNEEGKWSVAPAYDITFHQTRFNQHKMGIKGDGAIGEEHLVIIGNEFGISKKDVTSVIHSVKDSLNDFKKLAKKFDVSIKEAQRVEKGIGEMISIKKGIKRGI